MEGSVANPADQAGAPAPDDVRAAPRQPPRWWRQFVVTSRRANIFLWLEGLSVLALIFAAWANYVVYSSQPANAGGLPSLQVSLLLVAILVPALAIIVLIGRRLALRRAAGSTARLHVRLVFFFSVIAAVPTLLVSGFAAFLFQSGVTFWNSNESRGLMENANALAESYYDANHREVEQSTITMAVDMREILIRIPITEPDFFEFYDYQMQAREVSESAILQRQEDNTFRTAVAMDILEGNNPLPFSEGALHPGPVMTVST